MSKFGILFAVKLPKGHFYKKEQTKMTKGVHALILIFFLVSFGDTQGNEKAWLKDSDFGNFKKAKILRKKGNGSLKVWDSYAEEMRNFSNRFGRGDYGLKDIDGKMNLNLEYDEIWVARRTEFMTPAEIRKAKGKLDLYKLYWKDNKVQAFTAESHYRGDPVTNRKLKKPGYKLRLIYDRNYILKKVNK